MEIDVRVDGDSLSIPVDNPFRLDLERIMEKIENFVSSKGVRIDSIDVKGLLPKMVKGIAGCESGCPADAKSLVSAGFQNFDLSYIEGGILSAKTMAENGKMLTIKMFPDF